VHQEHRITNTEPTSVRKTWQARGVEYRPGFSGEIIRFLFGLVGGPSGRPSGFTIATRVLRNPSGSTAPQNSPNIERSGDIVSWNSYSTAQCALVTYTGGKSLEIEQREPNQIWVKHMKKRRFIPKCFYCIMLDNSNTWSANDLPFTIARVYFMSLISSYVGDLVGPTLSIISARSLFVTSGC